MYHYLSAKITIADGSLGSGREWDLARKKAA